MQSDERDLTQIEAILDVLKDGKYHQKAELIQVAGFLENTDEVLNLALRNLISNCRKRLVQGYEIFYMRSRGYILARMINNPNDGRT